MKVLNFNLFWDFFIFVLTAFCLIFIPVVIVFSIPYQIEFFHIEIVISIFFLWDIIQTLKNSQGDKEIIKIKTPLKKNQYIKLWFWFDLLAAIPFGVLFFVSGLLQQYNWLNIFLAIKIFKLISSVNKIQLNSNLIFFNPSIKRMVLLIFWILVVAHLIACGWILIASESMNHLNLKSKYIHALYWTITTLTTIGYGDITPSTDRQIIYVIVIEIIGAGMYGFIIGNIANLISNIDAAKSQFKDKIDRLNVFMKYREIPIDLQKQILTYFDYIWANQRGYDESIILKELPISLKTKVAMFLNRDIIQKVPFFKGANLSFIKEVILSLEPVFFLPGDEIVSKGDIGDEMYFISKGTVDVVSEDGSIVYATLTEGQFFGEIALLLTIPRTATVIARDFCDLYSLDQDAFNRVLEDFPEFEKTIRDLAEKRKQELVNKS